MRGRVLLLSTLLSTVAPLGLAGKAIAQEAGAGAGVEDIIVTARRTEERLQEAPVSVTAFTAQTMERLGVSDVSDVARRTPSFQYGDFGDLKLSPTSLRGIIGSSGSAGADPAVGYYVDEVFVGQGASANLDLHDVARIEVLRGPQGTLFGRNTVGGVISITTRRPGDTFDASLQTTFGDYDYYRVGGSISGPLGAGVSAGLSGVFSEREGVDHNIVLGRDVNSLGSYSLRGALDFDLGAETRLELTVDYRHADQEPMVLETIRYDDASSLAFLLDFLGLDRNADPYDRIVYSDDVNRETLDGWGASARLRTRIGGVTLTNVAAYRSHEYDSRFDTDRSPLRIGYDGDPEEVWRASEELRLNWETGPVSWLAGVYFYHQDGSNQSFIEIGADLADLIGDSSLTGVIAGSDANMITTSSAVFGSATWAVNERFDITLGARWVRDEKEIDYTQYDPVFLLGGSGTIQASDSWVEITPNLNVRYRFTPDVMAYLTVSNGFKSGGFNDGLGDANGISFDPETLWNYEIGLKTELFRRRLVANAALFYMDWQNIQVSQDNPATPMYDPIILNGGVAHSQGVEIEVQALPTDQLLLGASVSFLEAEYEEGTLPTGQPLQRVPRAPEYTAAFNTEYRWPVGDFGEIALGGEYLMFGESYLSTNNIEDARVAPYELVNARLSFENLRQGWRFSIWGENLTDETYKTRMFDLMDQDLVGQRFIALGEPRTYGVELRVRYGAGQ